MEEWRAVPDIVNGIIVSDRYMVSNYGNIKSIPYKTLGKNMHGVTVRNMKEKLVKFTTNTDGYLQWHISRKNEDGVIVKTSIGSHRAVAYAFLGYPAQEGMQVNHKDGNKKNNNVNNLEFVTAKENVIHSYRTGLASNAGERHPASLMSLLEVKEARLMHSNGCSIKEVALFYDMKYSMMWSILRYRNFKEVI